jgi:SAM-dependent methyltransferase
MIAEAGRRCAGLEDLVAFYRGDAYHLDFRDQAFDACRAERLLQHLEEPARALMEMIRVVRPTGRVVIVEPDYATLHVQGADPALTHTILSCRQSHFASPRIGSQLPGLFKAGGLRDINVSIRILRTRHPAHEHELLARYVSVARQAGAISARDGDDWLAELDHAGRSGSYRHAVAVFLVSAYKQ